MNHAAPRPPLGANGSVGVRHSPNPAGTRIIPALHQLPNSLKNASSRRVTLTLRAPAKLNLALAVGPPSAPGGMHPICSWMAPIALADELSVTKLEDDRLSRYAVQWHPEAPRPTPIDWPITRDLAVRAHLALEEHAGRSLPVQLKLDKRIPVGGGLGGGSSDAAAVLLIMRDLFALDIPDDRLVKLAMTLGSDVAFFLRGAPAVVEGYGERITHTDPVRGHAVLLFPAFGCPTAEVYREFDRDSPRPLRTEDVHRLTRTPSLPASRDLFNDLAGPAGRVAPELARLRARAADVISAPVHVTGSGSTLFALYDDECSARASVERLTVALPDCVCVTSPIG